MIEQIIPQEYCLKCQGCCRFKEADSIWAPVLLNVEKKALSYDKKIKLIPCDNEENNFLCPFLNTQDNKCRIYAARPFECQLYPFLINRKGKNIFLALDQNCAFVKENPKAPVLMEYAGVLAKLFNSPQYKKLFEDNPEIIQEYPGASNLIQKG